MSGQPGVRSTRGASLFRKWITPDLGTRAPAGYKTYNTLCTNWITTGTRKSPYAYMILLWGWFLNSVQYCSTLTHMSYSMCGRPKVLILYKHFIGASDSLKVKDSWKLHVWMNHCLAIDDQSSWKDPQCTLFSKRNATVICPFSLVPLGHLPWPRVLMIWLKWCITPDSLAYTLPLKKGSLEKVALLLEKSVAGY